jgi:hypothetical protein
MRPLCIQSQRPWRNGCVFVSWIAVPVDARMWAKNSGEEIPGGELAEIPIVPGRMGAAVEPRLSALVVLADAEAVAVRRRRTLSRVQALVDERPVAFDVQLLEPDRRA